jgi:fucose 4-O-acetylase-like acetyltransferase
MSSAQVIATTTRPAKPRIAWIDVARGIGIILVVYGHVQRGIEGAGILNDSNPVWLSDYAIYTFHMPLFFVLAGLNVEGSIARGKKAFLLSKVWTIAYPYLLWSIIEGGIQVLLPSFVNHQRSPLFMVSILWRPIAQFWFLYSLFLCHLVALVIGNCRWLLAVVGVGSVALSIAQFGNPTTHVLPFYIAGIFLGSSLKSWSPDRHSVVIRLAICALLFVVAEHFGRIASNADAASIYSLSAAVFGIAGICLLSQWIVSASSRSTSLFKDLGEMSMTIYILHPLFCVAARDALQRLRISDVTAHLLIGTLAGILVPVIFHLSFKRMHILSALGLAPLHKKKPQLAPLFEP